MQDVILWVFGFFGKNIVIFAGREGGDRISVVGCFLIALKQKKQKRYTMAIEYMTQAGYDKLKKDLADALAQRPVISAAIAEAREKGDLSENAEYDAARDAQGLLEVKIARLKEKVANARVIDESKLSADTVQLLSKVEVENLGNKMKMRFQVVGESEADFSKGLLSASTPIGKALIGHGKGEVVEAHVPSGVMKFKILDISL